MKTTLIIGGSGFVSGAMARAALARGDRTYALTRGLRAGGGVDGVIPITADRNDAVGLARAMGSREVPGFFDVVVDCIAFSQEHARQDLELFFPGASGRGESTARAGHLVVLSSDFVCSPIDRPVFIDETFDRFDTAPYGAGKRAMEVELLGAAGARGLPITVLRPCHIYGPGSLLGCLPLHGRDPQLLERIGRGEALRLLGGGHFLQHPIFVEDLVTLAFACAGAGGDPAKGTGELRRTTWGELYFAAGPDIVESRRFYQIICEILGVPVRIEEASIEGYVKEYPDNRAFCCHRLYRLDKLKRDGLPVPATGLRQGLERHVRALKGA
jgi:nucleoside-diphosphate-sugar epimerase